MGQRRRRGGHLPRRLRRTHRRLRPRVPRVRAWLWVDDGTEPCPRWATPYESAAENGARTGRRRPGGAAGTTSTSSTRAGPPGCPKGSCGARTTCSPSSTPGTSCGCPRTGASTGVRKTIVGRGPVAPPRLPAHARHRGVHLHGGHDRGRLRRHAHRSQLRPGRAPRHRRPRQRQHRGHRGRRLRQAHPAHPGRAPRPVAAVDAARHRVVGRHVERGDQAGPACTTTPT